MACLWVPVGTTDRFCFSTFSNSNRVPNPILCRPNSYRPSRSSLPRQQFSIKSLRAIRDEEIMYHRNKRRLSCPNSLQNNPMSLPSKAVPYRWELRQRGTHKAHKELTFIRQWRRPSQGRTLNKLHLTYITNLKVAGSDFLGR